MNKIYIVTVTAIQDFEELHPVDQDFFGQHDKSGFYQFEVEAENREAALDEFHATVPIKVLDDFSIECEEAE